ncbi:MAG: 50S ribosomal protein L9 [Salinivirgaceae bacterium]|nr:50S ribosomal protein L9 [Salinivirgaceae bacterium]
MEIILKQDIPSLGYKNDIVTVKDGYGRNYLIPQKMAVVATPAAKKMLAEDLKQRAHKLEKIKNDAIALRDSMANVSVVIATKVSSTGKIFGSVNNIQVAEALQKQGFDINHKNILVKGDAIKELGKFNAKIKLHKEVEFDLEFEVVAE